MATTLNGFLFGVRPDIQPNPKKNGIIVEINVFKVKRSPKKFSVAAISGILRDKTMANKLIYTKLPLL